MLFMCNLPDFTTRDQTVCKVRETTMNSFPVFIHLCTLQHKFFTYFTKGKKKASFKFSSK